MHRFVSPVDSTLLAYWLKLLERRNDEVRSAPSPRPDIGVGLCAIDSTPAALCQSATCLPPRWVLREPYHGPRGGRRGQCAARRSSLMVSRSKVHAWRSSAG